MNKVLLVFSYNLNENRDEFNKMRKKFEIKGYDIVNFNGIDNDFDLMNLPNYINYTKDQLGGKIDRISVLSNVREFIFVWYRAYNSLVDDFIYFIDRDYKNVFLSDNNLENKFYLKIKDFVGINNESIEGKIFININYKNYNQLFNLMLINYNFKYFNNITNFDYKIFQKKNKKMLKNYKINTDILKTDKFTRNDNYQYQEINLENKINRTVKLDKNFIKRLLDNDFFIEIFLTGIFQRADIKQIKSFLLDLFQSIKKKFSQAKIDCIFNRVFFLMDKNIFNFKQKISLLTLLVILRPEEKIIFKKIMSTLKKDKNNIDCHYAILTNNSFYKNVDNLSLYNNFYLDRRQIRDKIKDYIKKDLDIKVSRNKKNIAIIAHQLLSILHSPTKMLIKYINFLKEEHPEYNIKIFVEDVFIHNEAELFFPYAYSSVWSKKAQKEHLDELHDEIEIYYSNPQNDRKNRTVKLVNEIVDFSPELVWAFGPLSIALDILYEFYPTIYIALNTDSYFSESADVHMYTDKTLVLKKNKKYSLLDEKNIYNRIVLNLHKDLKPFKNVKRKDFGLNNNDFVMITVGNRLDTEFDEIYLDKICDFIKNKKNVKWFIVGRAELNYLQKTYPGVFEDDIITISYEDDLSALYQICDVYINPRRTTGGASVYIAINNQLPVVTLTEVSDASVVVGENNTAGLNMDDYLNELNKLYSDKSYRLTKIYELNKRLKKLDYKNGVEEFIKFFNLAKENYKARVNNK